MSLWAPRDTQDRSPVSATVSAAVTAMAEELAVKASRHHAVFLHATFNSSTFALKGKLGSLKADLPEVTDYFRLYN